MLHKIEQDGGSEHPIHLIFGVTNDADLVKVDELEGYAARMPNVTFATVVAAEASSHPNKGYVTHHMKPEHLNDGFVDIYLCGPPPMVDAVRKYLADQGIEPASFDYEKFSGSGVVSEIGESHVKAVDSDEAFDTRMALELGAAQLIVGGLRRAACRVPAAGRGHGQFIKDGHFTDPAGFREANSAFHLFPIAATSNDACSRPTASCWCRSTWAGAHAVGRRRGGHHAGPHQDRRRVRHGDFEALRTIIAEHTDHAKATMRAGIEKPGNAG